MPPSIRIPVYQPDLSGNERAYVDRCLQSTWISSKGEFIDRFQQGFAGYIGAPHALAVANGTVALHLALAALELGPGDEVIVPSLTYVAAVNAIRYVGATPVFADADPATWQVSVAHVAKLINGRTKAILAVHLYGQACDMAALVDLARRHRLRLIEDCAEAFGTKMGAKHVGTFGDIATFSFFGNKTITTGEGGMVVAADPTLHRKALKLRGQGLADDREYWHDVVGFNFRMTNICAAIGLAQFDRHQAHSPSARSARQREPAIEEAHDQHQPRKEEDAGEGREGQDKGREDRDQDRIENPGQAALENDALIKFGLAGRIGEGKGLGRRGIHGRLASLKGAAPVQGARLGKIRLRSSGQPRACRRGLP